MNTGGSFREWDDVWGTADLDRELAFIQYEYSYRTALSRLFRPGDRVLEAGCGFGRYCFWLAQRGIDAWGVDTSRYALAVGRDWAERHGLSVPLIEADVRQLPFAAETFDGYVSLGVLEHLPSHGDLTKALQEAWRVLRTGGCAYICVPNPAGVPMLVHRLARWLGKSVVFHRMLWPQTILYAAAETGFRVVSWRYGDVFYSIFELFVRIMGRRPLRLLDALHGCFGWVDAVPLVNRMGSGLHFVLRK